MSIVSSHNEWAPLEEVIVGTAINANIPDKDRGQLAIEFPNHPNSASLTSSPFDKRVIDETEEDIQNLIDALAALQVKVRRPKPFEHSKRFGTPDWSANGFHSYCPRDAFLVTGSSIIEAPMTLRSRFFETFAYKDILLDYFKDGARWFSAPKPRLLDDTYGCISETDLPLNNLEPIFDAANILRAGRDLFYQVSSTGNELGSRWLQEILGPTYRVHKCYNLYNSVHIDSTIALIRPGLVLLNPERVNDRNLPKALRKWDKIWCPELVDIGFTGNHAYSSIWVGMNILMINQNLAVVEKCQVNLIRLLEQYGVEVVPLQLRHARTLGGGFHCVTLDIRRKGDLEDYFT